MSEKRAKEERKWNAILSEIQGLRKEFNEFRETWAKVETSEMAVMRGISAYLTTSLMSRWWMKLKIFVRRRK